MATLHNSGVGDSNMLTLPMIYAACMVAFTGMRKAGLAKYLKPHQVTIAGAVGLTIVAYGAAYQGMLDMMAEGVRASVFFAHNVFFCVALNQRNEMPRGAMILNILISGLIAALCAFNASECDRYASLVLIILSLLLLGSALAIRSADDARKRENVLHGIWAIFSAAATMFCETQTMGNLYVFAGTAALLVAKINHPLLGDKLDEDAGHKDPEASTWKM